jgi:hypothetical protein
MQCKNGAARKFCWYFLAADVAIALRNVRFSGSRVQGRRAYRNAAFSASTAKKIPPSDKANNLVVALSFIAPELLS